MLCRARPFEQLYRDCIGVEPEQLYADQLRRILIMIKLRSLTMVLVVALSTTAVVQGQPKISPTAKKSGEESLKKGVDYLLKMQNTDGSWGKYKMPSVTALSIMALHETPTTDAKKRDAAIEKGLKNVLSFVQADGSIAPSPKKILLVFSTSNYANYNTAISLLALVTLNRPEHLKIMKAARAYLKAHQLTDPKAAGFGGFGYAAGKKADMSNTSWVSEALYYTEKLDKEPLDKDPEKRAKENKQMWTSLEKFLDDCQNLSEEDGGKKKKKGGDGGFGYRANVVSSGSITYAGLKSMVYAKLDRNDVRVKGVLKFVSENYMLKENPGQKLRGHFYYLQTMAKALDAYGADTILLKNKKKVLWRDDMIGQLREMQLSGGGWVNTDGRYLESVTALTTGYAMIAMKHALGTARPPIK